MINYLSIRVPKSSCPYAATIVCALVWLAFVPRIFSAGLSFAGVPFTPGATVRVSVPLSELEKSYVAEGGNAVPSYTVATLAVPRRFDPKKTWPVLVVFASSDHQFPNWYDLLRLYRVPALAEGWVGLTGDGPTPAPRVDSSGWRAGHTLAALDALHRSFPGSEKWPIACAGQSGGAKRASYLAPLLAKGGYPIAGIFLEGINEDRITEGVRRFKPGSSFLHTPIFLSSGDRDTIATLQQQTAVKNAMRRTGFDNVRHETFPGGHVVLSTQLQEALRWFRKGS
jgi:S-formylglutathione hydrolase FrmB